MAKKKAQTTNAMRILTSAKVNFKAIEYEYEGEISDNFGMAISEITGIDPEKSFKTLVLKGEKTGYTVSCIPVIKELDLKKLAKVSGAKKFEMIHVKDLLSLTGYIRGGVSPIGMKKKFPTYFDKSCENFQEIAVSGGVCGLTLIVDRAELLSVLDAKSEDIIK